MNNYTFRELWDIVSDDNIEDFINVVESVFSDAYGEIFNRNVCRSFAHRIFTFGLQLDNKTIFSKSITKFEVKDTLLPPIFADAVWEFQSKMKFNMYSTKLEDLNKKISSLKTSSESVSTNKFYENNNIKDNEGNWNSPQFLNRSENSDNNNEVNGSTETSGELAKYLKDLQYINWDIASISREIKDNLIVILSYPFNDDDEYVDNIPNIWKYD